MELKPRDLHILVVEFVAVVVAINIHLVAMNGLNLNGFRQ